MGIFVARFVAKQLGIAPGAMIGLAGYAGAIAVGSLAYWLVDRRVLAWREAAYTPARGRLAMALAYGTMTLGVLGTLLVVGRP